jgi:hypothetical protein
MAPLVRRFAPFLAVTAVCVWIAFANTAVGDYRIDGALAVHALAHGDVGGYLSAPVMMGPFSTLVQAPFAALGGGGEGLAAYQWACLPCLLALGLLGLYLARIARRRGMSSLGCAMVATLCLVNPLTFAAIETGHPEELLTAVLAVAAVAVASEGRTWRAALLLGLAVASKQWAVMAILPVLMALPAQRLKVALGAGAIALALTLPSFVAAPGAFLEVQHHAAATGRIVDPWSVWYPMASVTTVVSHGSTVYSADVHRVPAIVGSLSHSLIVLLVFAVPLALAMRRRRFGIPATDAMALLALLALLRCGLDPVSNLYYHAPLLLALIGWDAFEGRRWPLRALAGATVMLAFEEWSWNLSDLAAFNTAYIVVAVLAGIAIGIALFRPSLSGRSVRRALDVRLTPAS